MSFKEIPYFPDYYADTKGNIWSKKGKTIRLLKHYTDSKGYNRIVLYKPKNCKKYPRLVHHLVLETFIGPCPKGMEACHNDGNSFNNNLKNLRWDTSKNNQLDKTKHGTSNCGERNGMSKLNKDNVKIIKYLLNNTKLTQEEIANKFNVNRRTIGFINSNETWKEV